MVTIDAATAPEPGLREPHAQACIELQVAREVAGLRVGERVAFTFGASGREFTGRIRSFSCVDGYAPAALVLLDTPSRAWVHVERLDALRSLDRAAAPSAEARERIEAVRAELALRMLPRWDGGP